MNSITIITITAIATTGRDGIVMAGRDFNPSGELL